MIAQGFLPMLSFKLEGKGVKQITSRLLRFQKKTPSIVSDLIEMADSFILEAQKYPPETAANQPPTPYWSRGRGLIGKDNRVIRPSENLGNSWTKSVSESLLKIDITVTNEASYAPYVHGINDQAAALRQIGWRDTDEMAQDAGILPEPKQGFIERAVNRFKEFIQRG